MLKRDDWKKKFLPNTVTAILAEHVWEHLTYEEGKETAKICFDFLKPGGYIRCATSMFNEAGFEVKLLEYCDENGDFHFHEWDEKQGFIYRSKRFDHRNKDGELGFVSLIGVPPAFRKKTTLRIFGLMFP